MEATAASHPSVCWTRPGNWVSAAMCRRASPVSTVPRTRPTCNASRISATSCEVNALVEATPISGPACVYSAASATRVTMLPTTLQMAMLGVPRERASRSDASVSAVSPDWVMTSASVRSSAIGWR